MELAANKVKNTRIHERAARVKCWIYKKALLFDIDNNNNNKKNRRFCDNNNATVIS